MKANELRVNNYVEGVNGIDQILTIGETGVKLVKFNEPGSSDEPTHYFDWIKPIPLSEEWLLKFGFNAQHIIKQWYSYVNDHIEISHYSKDRCMVFVSASDVAFDIKYVHQLQNLYFALTGKELTLKSE